MLDEGYIKFRCIHDAGEIPVPVPVELITLRNQLFGMGLIGVLPGGIGFGNVSMRGATGFWITASQTGHIPVLEEDGYSWVTECKPETNTVRCIGNLPASSETMTHAACYTVNEQIQVVIHIHHDAQWAATRGVYPETPADIPYGTPAMAACVSGEVFRQGCSGRLRMEGHSGGLLYWGKSAEDAMRMLSLV